MTMSDSPKPPDDRGSGITADFRHGPSYARKLARHPEEMKAAFLVTVAGVLGFVVLLVASTYFPHLANPIRVAALVWFFVFGAIRTSLFWKRGAGRL